MTGLFPHFDTFQCLFCIGLPVKSSQCLLTSALYSRPYAIHRCVIPALSAMQPHRSHFSLAPPGATYFYKEQQFSELPQSPTRAGREQEALELRLHTCGYPSPCPCCWGCISCPALSVLYLNIISCSWHVDEAAGTSWQCLLPLIAALIVHHMLFAASSSSSLCSIPRADCCGRSWGALGSCSTQMPTSFGGGLWVSACLPLFGISPGNETCSAPAGGKIHHGNASERAVRETCLKFAREQGDSNPSVTQDLAFAVMAEWVAEGCSQLCAMQHAQRFPSQCLSAWAWPKTPENNTKVFCLLSKCCVSAELPVGKVVRNDTPNTRSTVNYIERIVFLIKKEKHT